MRGLSLADKWLLFKAIVAARLIKRGLKKHNYTPVMKFLKRHSRGIVKENISEEEVARYHKLITVVILLRPVFKINCLDVSLSWWFLLKRRGIITQMQFGVRVNSGNFTSHAWLEHRGRPLAAHANIKNIYTPLPKPML